MANKVYISLLVLAFYWIPYLGVPTTLVFIICALVFSIWLGCNGHRLAWQHRRFTSLQQFQETMKVWNTWGLWLFIIGLIISLIIGLIIGYILDTIL